ncbi:hypothetical protein [Brevibacillus borstelensis]|uniref:hypothetical protein n=1 Tax=Brevibacillus borstelensis TaxID=45462 RepID=UPI002E22F519|nr:hypothetical protein [Brevibacillus borstelensis]
MFLQTSITYKLPSVSQVFFLDGFDQGSITADEMIGLSLSPYGDCSWSRLAYSVAQTAFRQYIDEDFARIVQRKSVCTHNHYQEDTLINNIAPVKCLFFNTSFRSPGTCDWSREFKYYSGTFFFGGIGVFTIQLTPYCSERGKLLSITRLAQYSLLSGNSSKRLLIAIVKQDGWEIAFANIIFPLTPSYRNEIICRVKITLFKEPSSFIRAITSGLKVNEVDHEEHNTKVLIDRRFVYQE